MRGKLIILTQSVEIEEGASSEEGLTMMDVLLTPDQVLL